MNKHQLEFAVQWLENQERILQEVSEDQTTKDDFTRGFNKGVRFANKYYKESIKELRQLLDGYLVEDVDLDGAEAV
jgi:hypothetical protein